MIQPFAPPSANKAGHATISDYLKSKGATLEDKGLHYVQGWYTMDVMAKGLEKALNGGGELTGESIHDALEIHGHGRHRWRRRHRRGEVQLLVAPRLHGVRHLPGQERAMAEIAANQVP